MYEDDSETTTAVTAADLVNQLPEAELARVLRDYGEERQAARVARAIALRRAARPFSRTRDLAEAVAAALAGGAPAHGAHGHGHPATRTFMALRIAVNAELRQLQRLLAHAPLLLAPGASLAVISFHSLEDRLVKRAFEELAAGAGPGAAAALQAQAQAKAKAVAKAAQQQQQQQQQRLQPLEKAQQQQQFAAAAAAAPHDAAGFAFAASPAVVVASPEELARNPRARSAKLRVLTRLAVATPRLPAPPPAPAPRLR